MRLVCSDVLPSFRLDDYLLAEQTHRPTVFDFFPFISKIQGY